MISVQGVFQSSVDFCSLYWTEIPTQLVAKTLIKKLSDCNSVWVGKVEDFNSFDFF